MRSIFPTISLVDCQMQRRPKILQVIVSYPVNIVR